ncbi:hypothetical protein [Amycolatopsis sp. H20-H5]|uniref:hypothetical protein n=1 Tax=Amycolatopsis sp. H20-H5 TaxID=3046309 RepID=UPI002DB7D41A|nr:hypothetical protein [Amycolatopsis sp. H20-H5]MEC3980584.1 hypothetical protein [Amycolatopsis sp. H20-H5]
MLGVAPEPAELTATVPGDDLVPDPDVVMDRGFPLPVPVAQAWPWFAQLGRNRAGWYLPRWVEAVVPPGKRALRRLDPGLQNLKPGDVIDDCGGRHATFEIVTHDAPHTLVHRSTRGNLELSWAILLRTADGDTTRVHLRLRVYGVRHRRLVKYAGGFVDLLTVAGLAAGLRERLPRPPA